MAKENSTLALYRASRERTRKASDAALAKAVAAVAKKASGGKPATEPVKPVVTEDGRSGDQQPPAGDQQPPAGDPAK